MNSKRAMFKVCPFRLSGANNGSVHINCVSAECMFWVESMGQVIEDPLLQERIEYAKSNLIREEQLPPGESDSEDAWRGYLSALRWVEANQKKDDGRCSFARCGV